MKAGYIFLLSPYISVRESRFKAAGIKLQFISKSEGMLSENAKEPYMVYLTYFQIMEVCIERPHEKILLKKFSSSVLYFWWFLFVGTDDF